MEDPFATPIGTPEKRSKFWEKLLKTIKSETQNQPKEEAFRPDVPVNIQPKTSVRPPKSWQTSIFGTDMLRGRPRKKPLVWKTSGWFSVAYQKTKECLWLGKTKKNKTPKKVLEAPSCGHRFHWFYRQLSSVNSVVPSPCHPCCFCKKKSHHRKEARIFLPAESLKSLERKGKTHKEATKSH